MSFQTAIENRTPFNAAKYVLPDPEGQETVVVVVAATFEGSTAESLKLADVQRAPHDADVYFGDPGLSSVRYEADIALEKPFVDVLINGSAYAPKGRAAQAVPVHIAVADIRKDLLVTGDRVWRAGPLGASPSTPEPFATMPIVYERAFGGIIEDAAEPRNLVGVGFRGARPRDMSVRTELPNVERPSARMKSKSDKPEPAGLGAIGRAWVPRLQFAGTFDEQWKAQQWPLLPHDFDARFYQCAPADQQSRQLRGGEIVRLINLTPEGEWRFRLPQVNVRMLSLYDNRRVESELRLDTVLIEPDARTVTLTSRASISIRRNRGLLREIVLGSVAEAWIRARVSGKRYIDYSGRDGTITPPVPHYVL
jgi:hypothetical protein